MSVSGKGERQAGNSFANGPDAPAWLRYNWELREVLDSRYSIWTVMA